MTIQYLNGKIEIRAVDGSSHFIQQLASNEATQQAMRISARVFLGLIGNEAVCLWGLIPPSIMSDRAYLWLHVTEKFEGNEFVLVRHSQRAMELMQRDFPLIVGDVEVGNDRALKWIRWLGATFGEPEGRRIPFSIWRKGWTPVPLQSQAP